MGYERLGSRTERGKQPDVVLVHYCRPVGVWAELLPDGEDVISDCMSEYSDIRSSTRRYEFDKDIIDADVYFDAGFERLDWWKGVDGGFCGIGRQRFGAFLGYRLFLWGITVFIWVYLHIYR